MLKKSVFYVILSGLITSGAVIGWSKPAPEPAHQEEVAAQKDVKPLNPAIHKVDPAIHKAVLDAFDASSDMAEALKKVSEDERVKNLLAAPSEKKIRLVTPDTPPIITDQNVESAAPKTADVLAILNEQDKTAESYAFVDIAGNRIIQTSNAEKTADILSILAGTLEENNYLFHTDGQKINKLYWHCLDSSRNHCLVADMPVGFGIQENSLCDAAISELLVCGGKNVDLFGTNCPAENAAQISAIRDALKQQTADRGSFEINGNSADEPARKFNFAKTAMYGCDIYSVHETGANDEETESESELESETVVPDNKKSWHGLVAIGGAALAGILMILLGLVCVRRKDDESSDNDDSDKNYDALHRECAQARKERDTALSDNRELTKRVTQLETEVGEGEERNRQLNSQLEYARSQYKQEQLQRMNLAEENRRLEEELTKNKPSLSPAGDKQPKTENTDAKKADDNRVTAPVETHQIKDEAKVSDKDSDQVNNRVTVQTEKPSIEQLAAGASNDFFDSIPEDGWNEIEDSFDALFAPKKDVSLTSLVKDELPTEESGGFSGFFETIKENRRRDETATAPRHIDTQTILKPVEDASEKAEGTKQKRQLPTLRSVSPLSSGPSSLKSTTLNGLSVAKAFLEDPGLADNKMTAEEKKASDEKKTLEVKKTVDEKKTLEVKKVSDEKKTVEALDKVENKQDSEVKNSSSSNKGMDENSLLNALKRRVKDVSELDNNASEKSSTKSTGSFEYSHGLSKSGVFSVTGSRVDIDPFSDKKQFKAVYESYVAELKKIGEPTDKFTMEQFVSKLARQKNDLIKNGGYKNVFFTVGSKDGKPVINAVTQK
ncbi:MAG: hypothetical protein IJU23_03020 [Proteobacteria bacterium]|nr:hypothetical protein [Pseudomonadota bacterium]